jgi:hypothetical protein
MNRLVLRVGSADQRRRRLRGARVRHLLHADGQHRIAGAAGDGDDPLAHRRARRAAGCLHPHRLHAPLAEKVGDQSAELSLLVQRAPGHVAHVNGVDALHARIFHRRPPGGNGQIANGFFPMFAYRCLADAENGNLPHKHSSRAGPQRPDTFSPECIQESRQKLPGCWQSISELA